MGSGQEGMVHGIRLANVRAAVFDLGGVLLDGGPSNVRAFGPAVGLDAGRWAAISRELFIEGEAWDAVERGETTLDAFATVLRARLAAEGIAISQERARGFMGNPGNPTDYPLRQEMLAAVRRLKAVMPTVLLTNNIREWRSRWRTALDLPAHFDLVVDSSEVGARKPEPAIYALVEQGLALPGEALLFVDDLGVNLKTARTRGWQTIKYVEMPPVLEVLHAVAEERGG